MTTTYAYSNTHPEAGTHHEMMGRLLDPGSITRKYAPGEPPCVKVFIQPLIPRRLAKVLHGVLGRVTSSSTPADPTRQRSPMTAPLTSMPEVVTFSPNIPLVRSRSSRAAHASRSSRA